MQAQKKIAVAGATGRVGHHIVNVLKAAGHDVVAIARSRGVNVISGAGLAAALDGAECIIDAATGPSPDQKAATEFFTTAARNLQQSGKRAGVKRLIVVSIIGTDRFTAGYGAAKLAHEREAQAGPIPVTIVRAAQFHEFIPQMMEWGRKGDVVYMPRMRIQPVAARAVAELLADLVTRPSPAPLLEIAGPEEADIVDLARRYAGKRGDKVQIEPVSNAADPDREVFEKGALLPGPGATLAGPTFEEWLATQA